MFTAVDKQKFYSSFKNEEISENIGSLWRFMGLHITLSLQKHFQKEKKNKGHTILIFDNEEREKKRFTDLILDPPVWTDSYYTIARKQERLDQIVDVPHFVDSRDVGLIQLADFLCLFFLRKHIELQQGHINPAYKDEASKVENWASQALNLSIPKSNIYLSKGRCQASDLFYRYAPKSIL